MHHDLYQAFAMSSAFNFSVSSFSHFEFESLLKKKNESFLSFLHIHSSLETVLANKRIAYQSWVLTKRENQGWHEKSLRHAVHGLTDLRNCRSMALVTGFWVEAFTHPALSVKHWKLGTLLSYCCCPFVRILPWDSFPFSHRSTVIVDMCFPALLYMTTWNFMRLLSFSSQGFIVCPSKRKSSLL